MPTPKTSSHPNAIGLGRLDALYAKGTGLVTFGTDTDALNCIYITYSNEMPPNGTPAVTPDSATVEVDQDGAGTNQARITLTVKNHNASGVANSDVTFTIDCVGTSNGAWSSGSVDVLDVKGIIDAINQDDAGGTSGNLLRGFKAFIADGGMYDLVVTGALHFQDESAEYILPAGTTGARTGFLLRDMAVHTIDSDFLFFWRLGRPDVMDRGRFKLLDLYGGIGTDTGATVYVVVDDVNDYTTPTGTWATDIANHEEIARIAASSLPAGAGGANWLNHNPAEAAAVRGPIVVIVKGDTDAAQTVDLNAVMQAVS